MIAGIVGVLNMLMHLLVLFPVFLVLLLSGLLSLTPSSLQKLSDSDIRLQITVTIAAAITPYNVEVAETIRSSKKQQKYLKEGHSLTLNSAHLTGRAVDLMLVTPQKSYDDNFSHYEELAWRMKTVAYVLGIDLTWGGDWKTFKDGPHFQLKSHK